ncbi:MAG: ABC transporter ATP-binding protein [Candidatus Micrarchaeota archaeon]
MPILQALKLTKTFGDFQAVKEISFNVEKGEIFGVLGPNGAGKSTTLNMLATLIEPTSGTAVINGFDLKKDTRKVQEIIGLCTASTKFFWDFNAREILNYYAMLYDIDSGTRKRRIDALIERFEITDFQNKRFTELSTGMKQKIALAKSLINKPKLWFLDEPTNGLDLEVSKAVRKVIRDIVKEEDTTVLLTSHHLTEVEELCKRIVLINKGEMVVVGSIKQVKEGLNFFDTIYFMLAKQSDATQLEFIKKIPGVEYTRVDGMKVLVRARAPQNVIGKLINALEEKNIKIYDLEIKRVSLEDAFLKLIKGSSK